MSCYLSDERVPELCGQFGSNGQLLFELGVKSNRVELCAKANCVAIVHYSGSGGGAFDAPVNTLLVEPNKQH